MAKIKGKFITLTVALMTLYKEAQNEAKEILTQKFGTSSLDPEEFYDTSIWNQIMEKYATSSPTGDRAYLTLGRKIYPTIDKTVGLPENLKTPLDLIVFEGEGFELNHSGEGVIPRTWIKKEDGHVIVEAPAPGYNCKLYEGVFLGILEMKNVTDGKVEQKKCMHNGENTCEFHITW